MCNEIMCEKYIIINDINNNNININININVY